LKLSDFQQTETRSRNFSAEALCDANAKKILNGQVDCSTIPMRTAEFASGVHDPFKQAVRQIMHDALDESIDDGAFSDLDDEEPEEEVEVDVVKPRSKSRTARRSSRGSDAAFIAEHLNPNELCVDAAHELRDRVYKEQAANPRREFWSGLFYFLNNQKQGVRIRDVENKVCLSMLVSKTLAA
jgi:hypothetical protein